MYLIKKMYRVYITVNHAHGAFNEITTRQKKQKKKQINKTKKPNNGPFTQSFTFVKLI